MRACQYGGGSQDCNPVRDLYDDYYTAKISFDDSINDGIANKEILHHFVIDYWFAQAASSLKIENIHMYFNDFDASHCPMAQKLYSSVLRDGSSTGPTFFGNEEELPAPGVTTDAPDSTTTEVTDENTDDSTDDGSTDDVSNSESSSSDSSSDDSSDSKDGKGPKGKKKPHKHGKKHKQGGKKRGPKERMGDLVEELSL